MQNNKNANPKPKLAMDSIPDKKNAGENNSYSIFQLPLIFTLKTINPKYKLIGSEFL